MRAKAGVLPKSQLQSRRVSQDQVVWFSPLPSPASPRAIAGTRALRAKPQSSLCCRLRIQFGKAVPKLSAARAACRQAGCRQDALPGSGSPSRWPEQRGSCGVVILPGDIDETRFAMFRNGSPITRALSIASRSGLEQARHVLGIGQTSIGVAVVVKVRRTRSYSASTCGFQIRCFVFSATLSAYPAASAAFLSLRPLSFPNKNNRCLSVRPFLSSDLRRSSCSSRVGGFGSSKSSGLKSCEIRCFIAALSETISLLGRPIDLPHATSTRLLD